MRALTTPSDPYDWGRVSAVLDNGDVTVELGDGTVDDLPCAYSYWPRLEGQTVLIQRIYPSLRFVVGPIGGADRDFPEPPEIPDFPDIPEIPPIPNVVWGNGNPSGSGWTQSGAISGLWVRDEGDGEHSIYVDMKAPVTPPTPKPPPKPKPPKKRKPIWVEASWVGAWRDGSSSNQNDGRPAQSKYVSSYGHWSGGWGFPDLAGIVGGDKVASMKLEIKRQNSSHGVGGAETCHLYMASSSSKPSNRPSSITHHWSSPKLQRGQKKQFTLSSTWRNAFASGSRNAIICHDTSGDYIIYEKSARIRVEFA